jgi:hypothetical protein
MARSGPLLTEAQWKKGRRSRKNQAGQGDEVDGGGRRRGCSSGRPPSLCFPGGSPARGRNARDDPGRPVPSRGPTATETGARGRRQGLRQRSVAEALASARDRIDLSAQKESRSGPPRRTVARCDATSGAGSWSAPSAGWETSAAWSCATTARSESTVRSFTLPAS